MGLVGLEVLLDLIFKKLVLTFHTLREEQDLNFKKKMDLN